LDSDRFHIFVFLLFYSFFRSPSISRNILDTPQGDSFP
jgi:hypothetical protein